MGHIEIPPESVWKPLEMIVTDDEKRRAFVFMGTFVNETEKSVIEKIQLYKHLPTRRYLNADENGKCYLYESGTSNENPYRKISRREALNRLELEEL